MRKNIGWVERNEENEKMEIRVIFGGGDSILWRYSTKHLDGWQPFTPTVEHWNTLIEKTHSRYVRRQAPYKDLQLVERLAAAAGAGSKNPPQ